MPIVKSPFHPKAILRHHHIQTSWPPLFRKLNWPAREAGSIKTRDGDEILIDKVAGKPENSIAVILIHGLTGDSDSQYIVGLQWMLQQLGVMSVAINLRGVKFPNHQAKGYHAGSSDDVEDVVLHLHKEYPDLNWWAVGYSLGGNMLLKYLGEKEDNPLTQAIAVSVPFQLDLCSSRIDRGLSRLYRNRLLNTYYDYFENKMAHLKANYPQQAERLSQFPIEKRFTSFWDLDGEIIAPLHGFDSAQDYYNKTSSLQYLKNINTPTHIIHALDDPFMTPDVLPQESDLSDAVTIELSQYGGHVGFYLGDDEYYVETVLTKLLIAALQERASI